MQKLILIFLAFITVFSPRAGIAQGTVVLHDSFNDDTLGQAPGSPEIGNSNYLGFGTHTIINDYGSQSLRSVDATTSEGFAIQWLPTTNPVTFDIEYQYRLESYADSTSTLSTQRVDVNPVGSPIYFQWKHGGVLEVDSLVTSLTWSLNTTYQIRARVNCDNDTLSVWADGNALFLDKALGSSCNFMQAFVSNSSFSATISQSLDEIKVRAIDPIFSDGFESGNLTAWSATEPPTTPSGETCATAIPFTGGTIIGDLSDNTASGFTDTCGTGNTIDEWVSYTASCTGTVTVNTCYPSTAVDTILSAWSHTGCTGITEVDCNDDAPGAPPECDLGGLNRKSLATFSATSGATYVFRVSTFNDGVGAYEISASCTP